MKTFTKFGLTAALVCGAAVVNAAEPTYAPPVPTYPTEDVAPIFCETYGEPTELSTPNWGAVSQWTYSGTADGSMGVLLLSGMDQEGPIEADDPTGTVYEWVAIQLNPLIETKLYTYFHVDVYCNEETDFRIGLHSNHPQDIELYFPNIERGTMEPGKWYSIDYPIADLKYAQADNAVQEGMWLDGEKFRNANLLRIGNGPDLFDYSGEIYIANIYLFNGEPTCLGGKIIEPEESGVDMVEQNNFRAFVSNEELTCSANNAIETLNVYSVTGQLVKSVAAGQQSLNLNVADLTDGLYVVAAELANGQKATLRIVK